MSLEGQNLLKPTVKIEVIGGPAGLTGSMLEAALMKFQFIDQQGKKRFPKITMEFDNSSGKIFTLAVMAVGLKLKVRFGYQHFLSRPFILPIKSVRANMLPYPGNSANSPRPDVYGVVIMEAQAHTWPLHFRPQEDTWRTSGPTTLSKALHQLARDKGYPEKKIFIQEGLGAGENSGESEPIEDLSQVREDETTRQFLERVAAERGFVFSDRNEEFHFHRQGWKMEVAEEIDYFMGPDLLSFSIEGDYSLNTQAAQAKAIDPLRNKAQVSVGFAGEIERTIHLAGKAVENLARHYSALAHGSKSVQKGGDASATNRKKPPESISPTDIVTTISKKATEAAIRRVLAHAASKWALRMTVVGNPVIFREVGLNLFNFGPVVDGLWYVREVEHLIDGEGYTTRITAKSKMPKKGKGTKGKAVVAVGPSGLLERTVYLAGVLERFVYTKTGKVRQLKSKQKRERLSYPHAFPRLWSGGAHSLRK